MKTLTAWNIFSFTFNISISISPIFIGQSRVKTNSLFNENHSDINGNHDLASTVFNRLHGTEFLGAYLGHLNNLRGFIVEGCLINYATKCSALAASHFFVNIIVVNCSMGNVARFVLDGKKTTFCLT